jgi:hypothetical protein
MFKLRSKKRKERLRSEANTPTWEGAERTTQHSLRSYEEWQISIGVVMY